MVTLRPYQAKCLDRLRGELSLGHRRILVVAPTGAGKTTIAGEVISGGQKKGKKSIFLAHRTELIQQCSERLDEMGVPHGIIQGKSKRANPEASVQVASIDTLINRDHWDADILIVDEAHRSTSPTYIKILERYSNPVVLGLTATPYRMDGKGLGEVHRKGQDPFELYQSLVEVAAVQELIDLGYLVMPTVYGAPEVDMSAVRVTAGDYNKKDTAKAMEGTVLRGDLLKNWARRCAAATGTTAEFDDDGNLVRTDCNACTVVFAPSIRQSHVIVEQFKNAGVSAAHIDGKTSTEERAQILKDLRSRELTVVSNFGILCLDDQTEVLTRQGWRDIDSIREDDDVANWWPNDIVSFSKPSKIIKRRRLKEELMYSAIGRRVNIRITKGHRVIYKKRKDSEWHISPVEEIAGKQWHVPVAGHAPPDRVTIATPPSSTQAYERRLVSCSHHLRKNNGYGFDESKEEAAKRIEARDLLRYKSPHELTNDECWFIGFWLGDGSKTRLQSGGVEFKLTQSKRYPAIIRKIETVIESIGIETRRREFEADKSIHMQVVWSFARGTGFGPQQRRGVFHLEHYLKKDGVDAFWSLSDAQFASLIEGIWFADGDHGSGEKIPDSIYIANTNKKLLDTLQAIACCRGYYTTIMTREVNGSLGTKPIHKFRLTKQTSRQLVNSTLLPEDEFIAEDVWCVNVESTFIITRRNGRVAVLGNCEGWDLPHLEAVIGSRPTRSRNLQKQMIGRLMRPDDDKRFAFLFDHADWTRTHGFVNEPETFSLMGREKRPRKGDAGAPVRECPDCQALCHISTPICSECGFEFPKRELQYTDEDFVELTAGNIHNGRPHAHSIPVKERQDNFNRWCLRCEEEGYKPNWARMQYQRVYGEWPSRQTGIASPKFFWKYQKRYEAEAKKQREGATA